MLGQKLIDYVERKKFDVSNFFFCLLRLKKIYKKNVVWLDQLGKPYLINTSVDHVCISYAPIVDGIDKADEVHYSQSRVSVYQLKNVLMNIRSSSFLLQDSDVLVIERLLDVPLEYCDYSAGFIRMHNENYALIRLNRKIIKFKKIFFLGGNGCFNYYHWIMEIAPKILFLSNQILEDYPVDCIVCDASIENIESYEKILKTMLKTVNIDLPIVFVNKYHEIYAEEVIYINNLNNVVFNSIKKLSSVKYSHFSVSFLNDIRNILIQSAHPLKTLYSKIFLARKLDQLRQYNQEEVLSYFKKQGFQPVYLEEYSFDEQIALFKHADFIVGPSGAAWTNIIFCKAGCKGISWLSEPLSEFSVFSSLARVFECDLRFVLTNQIVDDENIHSDYVINVADLENLYLKMRI
ncbi:MAG: glycosyltransferase family 61 protein [Acinetobacter sp.]